MSNPNLLLGNLAEAISNHHYAVATLSLLALTRHFRDGGELPDEWTPEHEHVFTGKTETHDICDACGQCDGGI